MCASVNRNSQVERIERWQQASWISWWCSARKLDQSYGEFIERNGFTIRLGPPKTLKQEIEEAREETSFMEDWAAASTDEGDAEGLLVEEEDDDG